MNTVLWIIAGLFILVLLYKNWVKNDRVKVYRSFVEAYILAMTGVDAGGVVFDHTEVTSRLKRHFRPIAGGRSYYPTFFPTDKLNESQLLKTLNLFYCLATAQNVSRSILATPIDEISAEELERRINDFLEIARDTYTNEEVNRFCIGNPAAVLASQMLERLTTRVTEEGGHVVAVYTPKGLQFVTFTDKPELSIGSNNRNDMFLDHPGIASKHATITFGKDAISVKSVEGDITVNELGVDEAQLIIGSRVGIGRATIEVLA